MATQVVMPKLSPTMEEGQISRWLKNEGDKVSMGEPLAEIDTDKATMEMQALGNGVLRKILVKEGESAPLGQPIAVIGEADEDISALLAQVSAGGSTQQAAATAETGQKREDAPEQKAPAEAARPTPAAGNGAGAVPPAGGAQAGDRLIVSPLAARM